MSLIDLIFPIKCFGCQSSGSYLCDNCIEKAKIAKQICVECEKPSIDGVTHVKCMRPQGLDGCLSIWEYQKAVRKTLIKLKYKFAKGIAEDLADHVSKYLKKEINALPSKCFLLPIPLHKRRKNWRGFNQGEEIGKIVAHRMGWSFKPDVLVRQLLKRPQTELKGKQRKENVRGVFSFNPKFKSLVFSHKSLVIFDDVLTTGATMKEAAKVLKRNGAKNVWGLTIAR